MIPEAGTIFSVQTCSLCCCMHEKLKNFNFCSVKRMDEGVCFPIFFRVKTCTRRRKRRKELKHRRQWLPTKLRSRMLRPSCIWQTSSTSSELCCPILKIKNQIALYHRWTRYFKRHLDNNIAEYGLLNSYHNWIV